jgi:hypothetical protein
VSTAREKNRLLGINAKALPEQNTIPAHVKPYLWELAPLSQPLNKTMTLEYQEGLRYIVFRDSLHILYGLQAPAVRDQYAMDTPLAWNTCHDSLIVGVNCALPDKFRTESFTVPQSGQFLYTEELYARNWSQRFAATDDVVVSIFDSQTDTVLTSLHRQLNLFTPDSVLTQVQQIDLSSFAGRTVYATLAAGLDTADVFTTTERLFLESPLTPKQYASERQHPAASRTSVISSVSPNPFSTGTSVTVTLSSHGLVRCAVFDAVGREVSVLNDSEREAGVYTFQFDSSTLPSGTYYIFLNTTDGVDAKMIQLVR